MSIVKSYNAPNTLLRRAGRYIPEERNHDKDLVASLSLIRELNISKERWQSYKLFQENEYSIILPSWPAIKAEIDRVCPPLTITESEAYFNLDDIVEYTIKR